MAPPPVSLDPAVEAFIASRRVGHLATADADGTPHVIPVCYAYHRGLVYSALDLKPKRVPSRELKRVRNIRTNPSVALVVDDYSEEWDALAYVLIQGQATILESGAERDHAETLLREKYEQYAKMLEEGCATLRITPERVVAWGRPFAP